MAIFAFLENADASAKPPLFVVFVGAEARGAGGAAATRGGAFGRAQWLVALHMLWYSEGYAHIMWGGATCRMSSLRHRRLHRRRLDRLPPLDGRPRRQLRVRCGTRCGRLCRARSSRGRARPTRRRTRQNGRSAAKVQEDEERPMRRATCLRVLSRSVFHSRHLRLFSVGFEL